VKTSVSAMNPSEPSGTETLRYNEFTLDDTEIRLYARLLLTDQTLFSIFTTRCGFHTCCYYHSKFVICQAMFIF